MKKFLSHAGLPVVLDRAHIDTDQIIPKEHLKSIKRTGFETGLFSEWRYNKDGSDNLNFPLNQADVREASVLITGNNFGCGSSREHAVWALIQYGFAVIIAPKMIKNGIEIPGFADIFRNNSTKNGLLLIELDEKIWSELKTLVEQNYKQCIKIDLRKQEIKFELFQSHFEISASVKNRLLNGLDDVALTHQHESKIQIYEETHEKILV